jgi:sterol desaturase/sphingolipid hydroxylase (fatty acid hydroxylase superfamily)
MTATAAPRPLTRSRSTTLAEEFAVFHRQTSPRIMAAVVLAALTARISVGSWGGSDTAAVVVLLGVQPFFEWAFHVYVLHYRPLRLFGRVLDFELARKHREHHADPTDVPLIFVPVRSLVVTVAFFSGLSLLLAPTTQTGLTVISAGAIALLAYEWTHYLIHSRYRPKGRLYRALWRAHRLHHYKNEQYWFGVTNPAADFVLRTSPSPADVPTSPTARDLAAR